MKKRPRRVSQRTRFSELCAEPGEDDGIDPRDQRSLSGCRKLHRKTFQVCALVRQTLDLILSGECADERLQNLLIQNVQPAPDASRLLVSVALMQDCVSEAEVAAVNSQLNLISGRLRTELARVINRRKAPSLSFLVVTHPGNSSSQGGR